MKEFNLELAKQGHPVCTRDGRKVRILCDDALTEVGITPYPIVALVLENDESQGEHVYRYTENGKNKNDYENLPSDLMMASVKHEGWVNIYWGNNGSVVPGSFVRDSKDEAKKDTIGRKNNLIATAKIEWEE